LPRPAELSPAGRKARSRRSTAAPTETSWKIRPMDNFIWAVNMLSRIAGMVAAFFVALAVIVICDMVIERYIFNLTTIWQLDVVTYSIIATTFIGSAYVLMTHGHVNVDVVPIYLKPRARYWLAIFANLLALGFCAVLFILCAKFWYQAWSKDWHSDTVWRAPLWVPYFSMPLGLGLLVLQYIADLISVASGRVEPFNLTHEEHVA
jgi:TRAP-type C4-dicarboxylate transport system permease small subunit